MLISAPLRKASMNKHRRDRRSLPVTRHTLSAGRQWSLLGSSACGVSTLPLHPAGVGAFRSNLIVNGLYLLENANGNSLVIRKVH
ncbi:hypothetical protein [Bacillus sp. FJAT-27445]|uniref:hypothetical protein n=1 Tax=Bacillus sp. FJAT-27445 TaxID=1679166 RepID=UPI00074365D4|nr:hypothetical protein [Bacillus sp. FJAT-27445]